MSDGVSFKVYLKNQGDEEVRRFVIDKNVSTSYDYLVEKLKTLFLAHLSSPNLFDKAVHKGSTDLVVSIFVKKVLDGWSEALSICGEAGAGFEKERSDLKRLVPQS